MCVFTGVALFTWKNNAQQIDKSIFKTKAKIEKCLTRENKVLKNPWQ